jgi:hypothetical protein
VPKRKRSDFNELTGATPIAAKHGLASRSPKPAELAQQLDLGIVSTISRRFITF